VNINIFLLLHLQVCMIYPHSFLISLFILPLTTHWCNK